MDESSNRGKRQGFFMSEKKKPHQHLENSDLFISSFIRVFVSVGHTLADVSVEQNADVS